MLAQTTPRTLTRFLIEEQRRHSEATGNFTALVNDVRLACKRIATLIGKGALSGALGEANAINVQGEKQMQLDVLANHIFVHTNEWGGQLAGMASEEMEKPYTIPAEYPCGKYLLLFDPLDGSSNVDVNVAVGSIFSVLRCPNGVTDPVEQDFLQPGSAQVCAGYAIYGPSTMLVLTTGRGVHGFTLDREIGEFMLTHPELRIPESTSEFAINASNSRHWEAAIKRYVSECQAGKSGPRGATSTCAGSLRSSPRRIGSSCAAASSCIRAIVRISPGPAACACCTKPIPSDFSSSRPAAARAQGASRSST